MWSRILWLLLLCPHLALAAPALFFSDLPSGPKTGNSDGVGSGAIVTIWGRGLGSSQGTSKVYVGSVEAAAVYYWKNADGDLPGGPSDLSTYHQMQEVAFSIPAGAVDGANTIKVTVGGVDSNTLPFTVRAGGIKFVKATGNDSTGDGSWSNPWLTLTNVFAGGNGKLTAGDTVYSVGVGSVAGLRVGASGALKGTEASPIALVAYPNSAVGISGESFTGYVVYNHFATNATNASDYIHLSKLSITAAGNNNDSPNGLHTFKGCRFIGLEITGPTVYGGVGGAITGTAGGNQVAGASDNASGGKFLGNYVHHYGYQSATPGLNNYGWAYSNNPGTWTSNSGTPYDGIGDACTNCVSVDALQHLFYVSNRSFNAIDGYEIAWNHLTDNPILHGIHVYDADGGTDALGGWNTPILIHHNVVKNQRGYAIGGSIPLADTGPNVGTAAARHIYNNLVICDSDSIQCGEAIALNGYGDIFLYNNTVYGQRYASAVEATTTLYARNNIVVDRHSAGYLTSTPDTHSDNLFWSEHASPPALPAWFTSSEGKVNADPLFTNAVAGAFTLQAGSPAIGTGYDTTVLVADDFLGVPRVAGSVEMGAFEVEAAGAASRKAVRIGGPLRINGAPLTVQ
jgi:hypothetical protein